MKKKKLPKEVLQHFEEQVINNNRDPEDAITTEDGDPVDCLKNLMKLTKIIL